MSSLFDSSAYYILSSDLYGSNAHLNDGYNPDAPSSLVLGTVSYSSENWQVFFQDDVYFLRNYDYGVVYHLGLSDSSATQPQLLKASGDLSQQWNITIWPDGTRKLTNMAVGEFQFLGVSNNSAGEIIPVMNTAEEGSHWTFDINSSVEPTQQMLQPLSSVAVSFACSLLKVCADYYFVDCCINSPTNCVIHDIFIQRFHHFERTSVHKFILNSTSSYNNIGVDRLSEKQSLNRRPSRHHRGRCCGSCIRYSPRFLRDQETKEKSAP